MHNNNDTLTQLEILEKELNNHPDAEIKNIERLRTIHHSHTAAVCRVCSTLLKVFNTSKVFIIIEAEISALGSRSRPEDIVAWIEEIGILVVEVKSHRIENIRSFENNVPQVIYKGKVGADCDLLEQPRDFAYKLKGQLDLLCDGGGIEPPPLYFSGWLPNVTPNDIERLSVSVATDKVWLSDMLKREVFEARLSEMKNITKGTNLERVCLDIFSKIFGTTSGLRKEASSKSHEVASIGHLINRKNLELKKLTIEQEKLAFSPNLIRGAKVIRGVAGSGKSVVLANAVAETFLRELSTLTDLDKLNNKTERLPNILVLCYNRTLVPYLYRLIRECFNARKPESSWNLPERNLKVINIDRYAYSLTTKYTTTFDYNRVNETVSQLLKRIDSESSSYKYVFVDEGQDIKIEWYPLIQKITEDQGELGKSIIVFYDEAQNLYGTKMPGVGGQVPWKNLLGSVPNPRGLSTIMRVGHRNTNEILSLSYNLLLGSFADNDPEMMEFSGINNYEKELIPIDTHIDHPNAGKYCVERIDARQFRVNFAIHTGEMPQLHLCINEQEMVNSLAKEIDNITNSDKGNVDKSDILIMVPEVRHIQPVVDSLNKYEINCHIPIKPRERSERRFEDKRDLGLFLKDKVTVCTIKFAKGYTAHICHILYLHELETEGIDKERIKQNRAQLHVACTRSSLVLHLWGKRSSLMREIENIQSLLA